MHDALGLFAAGCKSHCEERGHQRGRQKGIDFWVHERVDDAGAPNVPETRASQRASNGNERTRKNRPWVTLQAGERPVPTIATLSMTVALEATDKGTHMSRFVELLEAQREALTTKRFAHLVARMLDRLQAPSGSIEMRFTYFVSKAAPVSGVQSQLDYEVPWKGSVSDDGAYSFWMSVMVPATSLCPCSKEISDYGAHNQRSCITIRAEVLGAMSIEDLIGMAERGASCEVYGLLKRPDEKYVTERAYDKPKFVEDIVRDVALALNEDSRIGTYVVEAENFESIHNHSAFARITSKKAL